MPKKLRKTAAKPKPATRPTAQAMPALDLFGDFSGEKVQTFAGVSMRCEGWSVERRLASARQYLEEFLEPEKAAAKLREMIERSTGQKQNPIVGPVKADFQDISIAVGMMRGLIEDGEAGCLSVEQMFAVSALERDMNEVIGRYAYLARVDRRDLFAGDAGAWRTFTEARNYDAQHAALATTETPIAAKAAEPTAERTVPESVLPWLAPDVVSEREEQQKRLQKIEQERATEAAAKYRAFVSAPLACPETLAPAEQIEFFVQQCHEWFNACEQLSDRGGFQGVPTWLLMNIEIPELQSDASIIADNGKPLAVYLRRIGKDSTNLIQVCLGLAGCSKLYECNPVRHEWHSLVPVLLDCAAAYRAKKTDRDVPAEAPPAAAVDAGKALLKPLQPCEAEAYRSFLFAQKTMSEYNQETTDKSVYDWLKDIGLGIGGPDTPDYDLPLSFATWQRHVRAGRNRAGTQKNIPRRTVREHGSSVVHADQIEPQSAD